jgi:hypothetical protein
MLGGSRNTPLTELEEDDGWWRFRTFAIATFRPAYNNGWTFSLRPESRLYKRWFDFPDMGLRGWAIIFDPGYNDVLFPGWVPPEGEQEAERWIEFLNALIGSFFAKPTPAAASEASAGNTAAAAKKRTLKLIGNFREMGWDDQPGAPSLPIVRGKRGPDHKADVVAYLRKAETITMSPGQERDFFDDSRYVGSPSMRTDGVYVWPDFLAGYVERYDVALPRDFERHMAGRTWKLPDKLNRDEFKAPWQ